MSLSEIIMKWGEDYVQCLQERFKPTVEEVIRELIEFPEDAEIVWTSLHTTTTGRVIDEIMEDDPFSEFNEKGEEQ